MFDVRSTMSEYVWRLGFLLPLVILLLAVSNGFAASPSVTAVLSNSTPAINQPVQLQIKVTGARRAIVPETISVDGLQIEQSGQSWESHLSLGFDNSGSSSSLVYLYTVLPLRAGQFKIPPQTIRVGNDSLRTPELTLNVAAGSNRSPQSGQGRADTRDLRKIGRVELVVPKQDAYVGEAIPAELRVSILRRNFAGRGSVEPPQLNIQGITTSPMRTPDDERIQEIDGYEYYTCTYKIALSAVRAGRIDVGPIDVQAIVLVSQPRSSRRIPRDIFDMDDAFDRLFATQQVSVTFNSNPVELNVKPLPPKAPANFSGAVGNFTMAVDAKPKIVQVGDPITVIATISGRGNFDRMSGPALEDERGWHKYPPSSKFKQDDDVGISGEKTFETVIAPNEKKTTIPPFAFAYFDPIKENYVTLRSEPVPIQVEGGAAPAPTIAAKGPTAAPVATPAPVTKPADILYQLTDLGSVRPFLPVYTQRTFWIAQIAPLILLFAFVGWKIRQAKAGNREAERIVARQHEMAKLVRELRRGDVSPQVYFSHAARAVQLKTALAKNINPNAVDAETVANTFGLGEDERAHLRQLFERSDELRYSGRGNGDKTVANRDREEVLSLLESLRA